MPDHATDSRVCNNPTDGGRLDNVGQSFAKCEEVNVISRRKLREFYQASPQRRRHADLFEAWFKLARRASWRTFQDVKALFGQTDVATDTQSRRTATIFDIGGNKYRIITVIDYTRHTVLITYVMDHAEYDRNKWKQEI